MKKARIADWVSLEDREPTYALVANVDLVVVRYDERVSVLYGRCLHRGALMADGKVRGTDLVCGVHDWDYEFESGVSSYNPSERLHKFGAWIEDGGVWVDEEEIAGWERENPQSFDRTAYQGLYQDPKGTPVEPHVRFIRELAGNGLERVGHHGPMSAMGVPLTELPSWSDLQFVTAQLARLPQLDDTPVGTGLVIGPRAKRPLELEIPIFVSDMSFGALSYEAKVALARGAELAGTGICSGEGGMLPEEQEAASRYFYELASARFGFSMDKLERVQAFHFKGGQGAKTGTGGHLPGSKVKGRIAEVRGLEEGEPAISPARFPDWENEDDYRDFAERVRAVTGGIPIGFKLSAQHIEDDLDAALRIGIDYVILDGRGGGTGAAPLIFRDNISVPTLPALARARRHLEYRGKSGEVTLIITGGLRTPADFAKALALGADGIAVSNAALQAIGCLGMRACHTNNCPVGIATQREHLRARLPIEDGARRLARYFASAVELMSLLARACGHTHLGDFRHEDLVTWKREVAYLTGVAYGGVVGRSRSVAAGLFVGLLLALGGSGGVALAVEIVLVGHPETPWSLEVSAREEAVTARHIGYPGLALEIDCDDERDDGRREGVVPVFGQRRLEGLFWGARAPFFYPILVPGEHTLERVRIEPEAERLRIRFEGGRYALLQPAAGREPLFAELVFAVGEDALTVFLDGLYYLLPTQQGTRLRITTTADDIARRIDLGAGVTIVGGADAEISRLPETGGQHREYFDGVSRVELESAVFGDMELVTWIERLQIQVDRSPGDDSDLFELDFDHSFKDRGQRTVLGRLTIPFPKGATD